MAVNASADDSARLLWQIGKADDDTAEFALAPNGYEKYGNDPTFIIGVSEPKRDWPYAHPGPTDAWAGSRAHAFTILFWSEPVPRKVRLSDPFEREGEEMGDAVELSPVALVTLRAEPGEQERATRIAELNNSAILLTRGTALTVSLER